MKKTMSVSTKNTSKDRGWAWVVLVGISLSFMIIAGITRGYGVIYAALVDETGNSAAVTSLIQGFRFGALCICAPIVSGLTERYTERAVLLVGSVIFSLGLILPYFTVNLEFTVLTLGVMTGMGMAGIFVPGQIAVGKYFDNYRSLANSISFCGSSVGTMSLPPLVMYLIHQYGLRGALLIYGGLLLNCVIGAAVVRPFKEQNSVDACAKATSAVEIEAPTKPEVSKDVVKELDLVRPNCMQSSISLNLQTTENDSERETRKRSYSSSEHLDIGNEDQSVIDTKVVTTSNADVSSVSLFMYTSYASLNCVDGSMYLYVGPKTQDERSDPSKEAASQKRGLLLSLVDFSLFCDFRYVLFLAATSFSIISFINVAIFLIPRAEEYGISREKSALLLTINGGSDILGRLILGVISDAKNIGPHRVMTVGLFIMGIATMLLPLAKDFNTMAVYVVMFGLFGSSGHLLCLPIVVLFVGGQRMPRAMGLVVSFHGIAGAISPPILGYIKDNSGTYDSTFYVCGACLLIAGGLMLVEPLVRIVQGYSARERQGRHSNLST